MTRPFKPLLLIVLVSAILAPKLAMAVGYMTGSVTTLTICTGHQIQTITLDAQGAPISQEIQRSDPCVMSIADVPSLSEPTQWQALHISDISKRAVFAATRLTPHLWHMRPPSHAPPIFV